MGLLAFALIAEANNETIEYEQKTEQVEVTVEIKITVIGKETIPVILMRIGFCESDNKQFNADGTVVKNPTSSAIGKYQIMSSLHRKNAESMGMDIDTEKGNTEFAVWLLEKYGTVPWKNSESCWSVL